MTDIAALGFDMDTQPITRVNNELVRLVQNATQAERAVDRLSKTSAGFSGKSASNINAAATAFKSVATSASTAAATVNSANTGMAASATAAATASGNAAAAAQRAATAQASAAAATNAAAAAQNRLAANTNTAGAAHRASAGHVNHYNSSIMNTTKSIGGMITGFTALTGYLLGSAVVKAADNYQKLTNAMTLAGVSGSDLAIVEERLFTAANKNGVPIDALISLYTRGSISVKELGRSQNDLLKIVDIVTASLRLQGTSTDAARGALLQLGQSFGTGFVHAEEYNSLMENTPQVLKAAALGMAGMDGSVNKLTNAVKTGKVSSQAFFDAIIKGGQQIIADSEKMGLTITNAWAVVTNGFTSFIGKLGQATGATKTLTELMQALGTALTDLSNDSDFMYTAKQIFEGISGAVKTVWEAVKILGKTLTENFGDVISQAVQKSIADLQILANVALGVAKIISAAMAEIRIAVNEKRLNDVRESLSSVNAKIEPKEKALYRALNQRDGAGDALKVRPSDALRVIYEKEQKAVDKLEGEIKALDAERSGLANQLLNGTLGKPDSPPPVDNRLRDEVYGPWAPDKSGLDAKGKATDIVGKKNKGAEDSYRKLIQAAENYIAIENEKTNALKTSILEGQEFVHYQELMNKALMAGIKPGQAMKDKFTELAKAMAEADSAYASAKFMKDAKKDADLFIASQEAERNALTMSFEAAFAYRKEQELLADAKAKGANLNDKEKNDLKEIAAATAAAANETRNYTEAMSILRDLGKSAIEGVMQALVKGTSIWDAFANAATRALDRVISKLADVAMDEFFGLFSSGSSSSSGKSSSGGGGILSAFKGIFGGSSSSSGGSGGFFSDIGGSLGNMWDKTTGWFGSMFGSGGGASPAAMAAPTGASGLGWGGIGGSGISAMGALGALGGGIGGLMSIMKGGTGNTIGGIGQMIGAGVSLIPGIGQIAGPIIMALSSILPSLLGGEDKREHSYTAGQLNYGSGGYTTGGGAWGPGASANAGQEALGQAGSAIQSVFDLLGGVKDASKVWGMQLNSWTASGKDWSYTSKDTQLVDPNGGVTSWRMNEDNMMDTGAAQVAIRSILEGALGTITDSMKTAMTKLRDLAPTLQEVSDAAVFVKEVYDELGKPALQTKAALKQLDTQFDAIRKTAEKLGLSIKPVDDALKDARKDAAKAFMHDINMYFDPVGTGMSDLADAAAKARLEINYLISEGLANASDLNKVNNYYLEQQTKLAEQLYGVTLSNIQDVIRRITTGDLSGATNTTQYNAAYAAFNETIKDALGGDTDASGRALDEAVNLANLGKTQYGTGTGFQNLKGEIAQALARLEKMVGTTTSPPTGTGTGTTPGTTNYSSEYVQGLIGQTASLQNIVAQQTTQINTLIAKLTQMTDLLQRTATNR